MHRGLELWAKVGIVSAVGESILTGNLSFQQMAQNRKTKTTKNSCYLSLFNKCGF